MVAGILVGGVPPTPAGLPPIDDGVCPLACSGRLAGMLVGRLLEAVLLDVLYECSGLRE
jgi:hypothetical protein